MKKKRFILTNGIEIEVKNTHALPRLLGRDALFFDAEREINPKVIIHKVAEIFPYQKKLRYKRKK